VDSVVTYKLFAPGRRKKDRQWLSKTTDIALRIDLLKKIYNAFHAADSGWSGSIYDV